VPELRVVRHSLTYSLRSSLRKATIANGTAGQTPCSQPSRCKSGDRVVCASARGLQATLWRSVSNSLSLIGTGDATLFLISRHLP